MKLNRRYVTAGATFFLAAATGHVMQSGSYLSRDQTAPEPQTVAITQADTALRVTEQTDVIPLSADASAINDPLSPEMPVASDVPVLPRMGDLAARIRSGEQNYPGRPTAADIIYSPFGFACASASMMLAPAPSAMIRVVLDVPCAPSAQIALAHAGLKITVTTDESGHYDGLIPAFASQAEVTAILESENPLTGIVAVPDLTSVRRIAVQWMGQDGFDLAATANARFDTIGIGAGPTVRLARVMTTPAGQDDPTVEVSAAVTGMTCGRPLSGQVIRLESGETQIKDLSFAMPDCRAVGEGVVMRLPETSATDEVAAAAAP